MRLNYNIFCRIRLFSLIFIVLTTTKHTGNNRTNSDRNDFQMNRDNSVGITTVWLSVQVNFNNKGNYKRRNQLVEMQPLMSHFRNYYSRKCHFYSNHFFFSLFILRKFFNLREGMRKIINSSLFETNCGNAGDYFPFQARDAVRASSWHAPHCSCFLLTSCITSIQRFQRSIANRTQAAMTVLLCRRNHIISSSRKDPVMMT